MSEPVPTASAATVDVHRVVDAVWRMESAKLIGALTRVTGDVGLAEELAQDALVAALEQWPGAGVPDRPGAWLMAAAKHRAIDTFRRAETLRRKTAELGRDLQEADEPDWAAALDEVVEDDVLRLVFIACHPVLNREARVALTLRLVGGLTTDEIARAFLVPEATLAQRIVRAKRTLTAARVPFEVPAGTDFTARLASVLEVIYLVFNEGYAATAGEDWIRPTLCQEALRLGRILAELTPGESEVHGLVALLELQASRLRARIGPDGAPVLLGDQDRTRWDRVLIGRGLAALERAEHAGGSLGPYALQAAIAACHARARTFEETDWVRIAALYEALAELTPSPVVELNRAVAVSRAYGAAAGLDLVDALTDVAALRGYHLLPSVRGDLLEQLGRLAEARAEFERAAALTRNEPERALLLDRAAACGGALSSEPAVSRAPAPPAAARTPRR
ncbi:RNA polymerase sigma factor [Geodermatophilus sp. URMC 64]